MASTNRAGSRFLGNLFGMKKQAAGGSQGHHQPPALGRVDSAAAAALPEDSLAPEAVVPQFFGHMGVPRNADAVAYDADQKLLAAATEDGRVKVYGKPGVELLFVSASRAPTRSLQFVPSRPGVLRIAQDGLVEVFSLVPPYGACGSMDALKRASDPPLCAEFWPSADGRDLVLLGCDSGALKAAQLQPGAISGGNPSAVIRGIKLLPYSVSASGWGGPALEGGVLGLSRQPGGSGDCLLVAHPDGLVVWSLRYAGAAAGVHRRGTRGDGPDLFEEVGALMAACWSAEDGSTAASAHSNGDVILWRLPDHALPGAAPPPGSEVREGLLEPLKILRVSSDDCTHGIEAVFSLGNHRLLVRGGQSIVEPEGLAVLHTDSSEGSGDESEASWEPGESPLPPGEICCEMTFLPWFGTIRSVDVVVQGMDGSGNARAQQARVLLLLSEDGQLIVHRVGSSPEASLIEVSSQETGEVSHLSWLQRFPPAPGSDGHRLAVCVDDLKAAKLGREDEAFNAPDSSRWSWLFDGGEAFDPSSPGSTSGPGEDDMLVTGLSDGRCVLWDGRGRVPVRAAVVPASRKAPGRGMQQDGGLAPVTAVAMCWMAGILAVGHRDGGVRLYQWSTSARDVTPLAANLHGSRPARQDEPPEHLAPGFHLVMTSDVHAGEAVTQIALGTAHHLAAFGDAAGNVSLFDLGGGAFLFMVPVAAEGGISGLHFGALSQGGPEATPAASASLPTSPLQPPPPNIVKSRSAKTSSRPPALRPGSHSARGAELVLYCLLQDFSMAVVDCASSRVLLSSPCPAATPREGHTAVMLRPLDESGAPQPPPAAAMRLLWVDAVEAAMEAQQRTDRPSGDGLAGTPEPQDPSAESREPEPEAPAQPGEENEEAMQEPAPGASHAQAAAAEDDPGHDSDSDSEMLAAAVEAAEAAAAAEGGVLPAAEGKQKPPSVPKGLQAMGNLGKNVGLAVGKNVGLAVDKNVGLAKNMGKGLKKVFQKQRRSLDNPGAAGGEGEEAMTGGAAQEDDSVAADQGGDIDAEPPMQPVPQGLVRLASGLHGRASPATAADPQAERELGVLPAVSALPPHLAKLSQGGPQQPQADTLGSPKTPSGLISRDSMSSSGSVATFEVQEKARWTAHLLLVSKERMEVCPATYPDAGSNLGAAAAREICAEVVFPPGLQCLSAMTFSSAEGAGAVVLTPTNQLVVYSLPRLASLLAVHLEYCLGWPIQGPWRGFAATGPEGQLALASPAGELVRLGLVSAMSLKPPASVFVPAASAGSRRQHFAQAAAAGEAENAAALSREGSSLASQDGNANGLLSGLEKLSGDLMKSVGMIPETRQPMDLEERFSQGVPTASLPSRAGSGSASVPRGQHPAAKQGQEQDDSIEIDDIEDEAGMEALEAAVAAASAAPKHRGTTQATPADWELRAQQQASGSRSYAIEAPRMRTADEIKQKYGRKKKDPQSSAAEARSVMNENMMKLNERGERLSKLQEKTAAMENNAKGFMEMAKEIHDREANRKWWQF